MEANVQFVFILFIYTYLAVKDDDGISRMYLTDVTSSQVPRKDIYVSLLQSPFCVLRFARFILFDPAIGLFFVIINGLK